MSAQDEQGRRLALIVGGSDYQDPTLQKLRAPGRDASDLAEVLRDPAIGAFDVGILINMPSDRLLRGIAQFCHQADPGDLVLVYLSCHGVLDDRGRLYYATINTERALLSATAVAANWLNDQLDDCRARQQILLLDCCHSGAFAKGSKGDDALALRDRFSGRGRVVLTASRATEYSFEGATVVGEGVRSMFTHAVVNGLRTGQADRDKDGLVTVEDLYHHVYATVRDTESRQTPELWAFGAEGDLLIARSVRGPIIEPAPLPDDMRVLIENSRLVVRESGVKALAELLDHGEPGLALTARLTLQRISEEDLPRIAALARAAYDADDGQAVTQLEAQERARREAEQEVRRQEAERAAAQRQQQIEQLQDQIRDHGATQDWDALLAVSDQLAALDPAAADPDGLASTAREQLTRRQQGDRVAIEEQACRETEKGAGAIAKEDRSDARQRQAIGRAIPGALARSVSDTGALPTRSTADPQRRSARMRIVAVCSAVVLVAGIATAVSLANGTNHGSSGPQTSTPPATTTPRASLSRNSTQAPSPMAVLLSQIPKSIRSSCTPSTQLPGPGLLSQAVFLAVVACQGLPGMSELAGMTYGLLGNATTVDAAFMSIVENAQTANHSQPSSNPTFDACTTATGARTYYVTTWPRGRVLCSWDFANPPNQTIEWVQDSPPIVGELDPGINDGAVYGKWQQAIGHG